MNFSIAYTKEQEEFAKEVREWIKQNVPEDMVPVKEPRSLTYEQWQQRREVGRKLGEKGWNYPTFPIKYGGAGLDRDRAFVVETELFERGLGPLPHYSAIGQAAEGILAFGTEEQKKRFLPLITGDEVIGWQLYTEPDAGSDEANQQTNALRSHREGDYFIVNGSKTFVGGGYDRPDYFWLLTRSDLDAPRHQNLAMFFAPTNLPGITIQPLDLFVQGYFDSVNGPSPQVSAMQKQSVFFDDVKLHESYLIGGDHEGWKVLLWGLVGEHGDTGHLRSVNPMYHNLLAERLLEECRSNPKVGKRLRENPELLNSLVNVYIAAQVWRLFDLRNHWLVFSGRQIPYAGPQIHLGGKLFQLTYVKEVGKILGPYAVTNDTEYGLHEGDLERGLRHGVAVAPAGSAEMAKILISRALAIGR